MDIKYFLHVSMIWIITMTAISCDKKVAVENHANTSTNQVKEISLTLEQEAAAGIELGHIERRLISERIRVNGYFEVPPGQRAIVNTYMGGYIKKTDLLEGDKVYQGQVMATLQNPEYVHLQQNYLELLGQLNYLKSEFDRQEELSKDKINAKKNLLKAEADYNTAQARFNSLKTELEMMGLNIGTLDKGVITPTIYARAPINGYVTKVSAILGKYANATEALFEIVDTDHIHLELSVYEKDILKVKKGQFLEVTIPGLGNEIYKGEIHLVGKSLDMDNRSVNVHGHIKNDEGKFLPGMFAEASIILNVDSVMALPVEAIISSDGEDCIYVKTGQSQEGGKYKKVGVEAGLASNGWTEIMTAEDKIDDAEIVIKGAYYLSITQAGGVE